MSQPDLDIRIRPQHMVELQALLHGVKGRLGGLTTDDQLEPGHQRSQLRGRKAGVDETPGPPRVPNLSGDHQPVGIPIVGDFWKLVSGNPEFE